MSDTSNEDYVRSRWKALGNLWWDREYDENWISASDENGKHIRLFAGRSTKEEAWSAARAFTEAREEDIRLAEIDCDVLREFAQDQAGSYQGLSFERSLLRTRAHLAELKRGMK